MVEILERKDKNKPGLSHWKSWDPKMAMMSVSRGVSLYDEFRWLPVVALDEAVGRKEYFGDSGEGVEEESSELMDAQLGG